MKRNTYLAVLFIVILLVAGWAFFRAINPGNGLSAGNARFQTWFWEFRSLDLMVQVLLVFAGTLGIAAILPIEEDDD